MKRILAITLIFHGLNSSSEKSDSTEPASTFIPAAGQFWSLPQHFDSTTSRKNETVSLPTNLSTVRHQEHRSRMNPRRCLITFVSALVR